MESLAKFFVISRKVENGNLKGFMLADSLMGEVLYVPLESIQKVGNNAEYENAVYDSQYKTLNGTYKSLTSYPEVSMDNAVLKSGIVVFRVIVDKDTGKHLGVVCFDALGVRYNYSFKKLNELCRLHKPINFKFVSSKKYGDTVVKYDGTEFDTVKMQAPKKENRVYNSALGEKEIEREVFVDNGTDALPSIGVYSIDDVKNSSFAKSAQEKMFLASINMSKLTPYYHCCLQAIKKLPVKGLGTFCVTEDTMYYDIDFVAGLTISELTFILIHEICHIAMQHSVRSVGKKNGELWNIACDLYINTIICKDFELPCTGVEKEFPEIGNSVVLKAEEHGFYLEKVNEVLDLARDTPETIYDRLYKENPNFEMGGSGQGNGQNQNQNQQGNQQQGQGDGQGQQGQGQQSQGQQGQGQQGQGQSQQGQGQQGQGNNQGNNGGRPFDQGSNTTDSSSDLGENQSNGDREQTREVTVTYNGKKMTGRLNVDIATNNPSNSDDSKKTNLANSRSALQKIKTKKDMVEQELGEPLVKRAGGTGSLVQRYIDFGLSANVNWQQLMKNMCKKGAKKVFTLGSPNVDYMNMGMTIADRRAIGKPVQIGNIKICIDVSGSVSKKDLELYLSEVSNIFTKLKASGELIYWSTQIGDAGDFHNIRDLLKVAPKSTGGTNVKCVFDYLTGKIEVNGRKEQTKVRDITGVFIITDGCFDNNYAEYEQYFGKRVVWIIDGNTITFNPPFGRVVSLKENN